MRTIRALIIRPGEVGEEIRLRYADWPTHAAELIGAEAIQPVNNVGDTIAFLCDEEGSEKGLSYNQIATSLISLIGGQQCIPLVGTVIITGVIRNGNPTDVAEGVAE